MAIYSVKYKFQDVMGTIVDREVLVNAADEAAMLVIAAAHAADLDAFSKCGVVGYTYSREVTLVSTPAASSSVDAGATITWNTSLPIDPVTHIPDPIDALKLPGRVLDTAATEADDIIQRYLAGDLRVNRNNPVTPASVKKAVIDK